MRKQRANWTVSWSSLSVSLSHSGGHTVDRYQIQHDLPNEPMSRRPNTPETDHGINSSKDRSIISSYFCIVSSRLSAWAWEAKVGLTHLAIFFVEIWILVLLMGHLYQLSQISRIVISISLVSLWRFLYISSGETRSRGQKGTRVGVLEGRNKKDKEVEGSTYRKLEFDLRPRTYFCRI